MNAPSTTTLPAPAPPKRRRHARRALFTVGTFVPALLVGAGLALYGALNHERGSAWLLTQIPGLQIEAPQGPLLGDFSARRVTYLLPDGRDKVELHGVAWRGLSVAWHRSPLMWADLHFDRLQADRVTVTLAPSTEPTKAPTSLHVPLAVAADAVEIGRIDLPGGAQPLLAVRGRVAIGEDDGARHRVELAHLQWDKLTLAGRASVQTGGKLDVAAALTLASVSSASAAADAPLPPWSGTLTLAGPLAELRATGGVAAKGQSLRAEARVRPFAPWPLAGLNASAEKLDLSALISGVPQTALTGTAELDSTGLDKPATLKLALTNAAAGRWDQQRLPVQQLTLALQTRLDRFDELRIDALDARLGAAGAPAGRIAGRGAVQRRDGAQRWSIEVRAQGLRTAALDARLAPLQLDGPIELSGGVGAPLGIAAKLAGTWQQGKAAVPLQLGVDASVDGGKFSVPRLELASGQARLAASGSGSFAGAAWSASAKLALQDFDPRIVWHGDAAWLKAAHRLNASAELELRGSTSGKTWPQGRAQVRIEPSQLAGVALQGRVDYDQAADATPARVSADLDLGGNRFKGGAALAGTPRAAAVDAELDIAAPKLSALTPLVALQSPKTQAMGEIKGRARASLRPDGRGWTVSSEGNLDVANLQLLGPQPFSVGAGKLAWNAAARPDAPLMLKAELQRVAVAGQIASKADIDLKGSWAEHRLDVALEGQLAGARARAGSAGNAAALAGQGRLLLTGRFDGMPSFGDNDRPLAWRGRIDRLLLRPTDAKQPDLLKAADVDMLLQWRDGLQRASAAPGQVELAGARLRWSELQWQSARRTADPDDLRAELKLEPLELAPLLKRWQPDFGWGGNLVVVGHASVRTAPRPAIDVVVERASGDLSVTDERGVQALGLTDLRVGLTANNGLWQFTQALAGTNMGSLGGAITVHAAPQAMWPAPNARLEGVMQANVANLGTWGGWVPAGWRLGGHLSAGIELAGRFGGPEVIGRAEGGQLSVRNAIEGISVTDGEFALRLNGPTATLDRLSAKAGSGRLTAEGAATLGEKPQARLQLVAEQFQLLNRVDRRLQASGNARLELAAQALQLDGQFSIDEGLFDFTRGDAPSLDSDVYVLRPDQAAAEAQARQKTPARKTRIAVALDLGRDLKLRGRGIDTRLRGELKLTQNDGPPQLNGTVRAVGGTYAAYGQKLEIERGEVAFVGPFDNPRLDVQAIRPDVDVRVGVSVGGTALAPRVRLFSEPAMSDTDKLSWLVLGRAPEGLGRADTALLQRAAMALLSGEGESGSNRLIKNIGLDELSVMQNDDDARGTVVRLGKQLSRRWYVGYERGLNATTGSWQLVYRIAQRFTLRAQSGEDNALDLIWQWKWN